MNLAAACELIEHFEGCVLHAYPDPGTHGVPWTIGFGTTQVNGHPVQKGMTCTLEEAKSWLLADVQECAGKIQVFCHRSLTDAQLSALISLAYNIGVSGLEHSTLMKKLNSGDPQNDVGNEFLKWTHGGGRVLPGLVARRKQERALFLSHTVALAA